MPSPPDTPGPDPKLAAAQAKAEARAKQEREDEEARKKDEQSAFARGLRGQRALLSDSFTGFDGRGIFSGS